MTGQEIAAELKVHPDVMKIALHEAGVEVLRGRNPKDYSEKEKAKIVKAVELVTAGWKHPKAAKKEKVAEKPEPKKVKEDKPAKKEEKKVVPVARKPTPVKKPAIVEDDDDFEDEEDEEDEEEGEEDDLDEEDDDE
jgi:hypothetical protein